MYRTQVDFVFCEVRNDFEEKIINLNSSAALSIVSFAACVLNTSYFTGYEI